jgi:hypothetical protein
LISGREPLEELVGWAEFHRDTNGRYLTYPEANVCKVPTLFTMELLGYDVKPGPVGLSRSGKLPVRLVGDASGEFGPPEYELTCL